MKSFRALVISLAALAVIATLPHLAEAQRRGVPRRAVQSVVFIGGAYYPRYVWFDPWYGPAGPYGYGLYGPYGPSYGYPLRDYTSAVRIDATPRDAQVIVDGYSAGLVDDFDGIFQRLRLRPGGHEIVLYLEGYRTIRQRIYVNPGSDQRLRYTMQPLAPGETPEPPPPPADRAGDRDGQAGDAPPLRDAAPVRDRDERGSRDDQGRFGTLALRVQPADAEILVDGEQWTPAADSDRVSIRLTDGRHHVEVRRNGLSTYSQDVLIREGRTLAINVSLSATRP
jgi:hypothetical protein